ncbi:MAG: hypothetical protein ACJAYU_003526 [Bradymonadia bacterium]|jgi:hypothetical protein
MSSNGFHEASLAPERLSAMHEVHEGRNIGKKQAPLEGGIPATDYADLLPRVTGQVASHGDLDAASSITGFAW